MFIVRQFLQFPKVNIISPPLIIKLNHSLNEISSARMRFSSDEEFFEENSRAQHKNDNVTPKKKQKKETMLSKFLDSIDGYAIKQMLVYEKLKRPVFQRRPNVPQKLSLYEDVLFISVFKQNQEKINADSKHIKTICLDLESRTKRKQCTIRERVQKKLCKMSIAQFLEHIVHDKDISFNLKKILTSSSRIATESNSNQKPNDSSQIKQSFPSSQNCTPQKQSMDEKYKDVFMSSNKNSPSKFEEEIFEENEKMQEQVRSSQDKVTEEANKIESQNIDESGIYIVFNKKQSDTNIFMFNKMLIHKEIMVMKQNEKENQLKEKENQQKEELMKQLKLQMQIINHFKNQTGLIPHEIQALITEAQKITKIIGISTDVQPKKMIYALPDPTDRQNEKIQNKMIAQTNDKKIDQMNPEDSEMQNNVSEFTIEDGECKAKKSSKTPFQWPTSKYTISYSLCDNEEYIKLYKSDPNTFEPLLWSEDQDILIQRLIQDYESNKKLFQLLIRYKGPQTFIDRCIFLKKNLTKTALLEAVKSSKPLNISKLNIFMNNCCETLKNEEAPQITSRAIECE